MPQDAKANPLDLLHGEVSTRRRIPPDRDQEIQRFLVRKLFHALTVRTVATEYCACDHALFGSGKPPEPGVLVLGADRHSERNADEDHHAGVNELGERRVGMREIRGGHDERGSKDQPEDFLFWHLNRSISRGWESLCALTHTLRHL